MSKHREMKPIEPPDSHYFGAAIGWLELGNPVEANEELKQIAPELEGHPAVLALRYDIHAKSKDWERAVEAAGALVRAAPEESIGWLSLAYATRRNPGGGLPQAREILTQAQPKFPGQYLIPFNLACYECQLGNLDTARKWLEKAFAAGDAKHMKRMALRDPDLEPMWKQIGKM